MLYDLEGFQRPLTRDYTASDITLVVAVRSHAGNPWVLERLTALADYYAPRPHILVVDFGSPEEHQTRVRRACEEGGFELLRIEDDGLFCLAAARNAGAHRAKTDLLFFSDIDCFGESDLFARLVHFANTMEMGARFDLVIDLPVYHLAQAATDAFFAAKTQAERSRSVAHSMSHSVLTSRGAFADYVDPHSNFFLIRRDFFDYMGGINDRFRGHGSEDFEFFLRIAMYQLAFPVPTRPLEDGVSPRQKSFYEARPYAGFRRLFELMSEPAQLAGLRIAHMHHDRGKDASGWYENNDWSRTRFLEQVMPYARSRITLLEYDFMPREKTALVLIRQETHTDVFFALRLAGYRLIVARPDDRESLRTASELLEEGKIDAVTVFNPYMRSHTELRPLFESAREKGIKTIVFERGALPESWYYGPDMSYADPDYTALELREDVFSPEELSLIDQYIAKLRAGSATLEANGDYQETTQRLSALREKHRKICLIPLQLDDDVAVTFFNAGYPGYRELVDQIGEVALEHADILFLVKAHPLSKIPLNIKASNVVLCSEQDHIHALIDLADGVICYNSGVGLLALIHEKPLVTLGNAYYNLEGLGHRAKNLADAVELIFGDARAAFHTKKVRALVAWLVLRKYSFFRSDTVMRESPGRKAHGYKNMLAYQLNLEGTRSLRRVALDSQVPPYCYATARMGVGAELNKRAEEAKDWLNLFREADEPRRRQSTNQAKLQKLLREPRRFFEDSRIKPLRIIAPALPTGDSPSMRKLQKLVDNPAAFFEDARNPAVRKIGRRLVRKRS